MPAASLAPVPGACYKFTVGSAEEAAALIRERLGADARVLSVRNVPAGGLRQLWAAPRLEVVARFDPAPVPAPALPPPDPEPPDAEPIAAPSRQRPATRSLRDLLRRSGLSETALGRLQAASFWSDLPAVPLHRALGEVGRHLRREAEARTGQVPLSRAAFLGAPGVGRTTALCKWLGNEVFRRGRLGHVVSVEFDRPNPPGPLPVFCEALGVPVAHFPATTLPAVPGGFVYLDVPGISSTDLAENARLAEFLARERIEQRVLVLNAAYDHAALRAAYAAGRALGATHLVFTHLDEVPQWGRLWDYLMDTALEPLFLATGPSLTGDCEENVCDALVRRTLSGGAAEIEAERAEELPALVACSSFR
jgi:flagellar biosynthesis protein FlhF